MFRRRFTALAMAAGCLLSQSGCLGLFDRDRSATSSGCPTSSGGCCGGRSGGGLLGRWFGGGSNGSNAGDVPVSIASAVSMPMGGMAMGGMPMGGDCTCNGGGGIYQPVGLPHGMQGMQGMPSMQTIPGVPAGVPVTVGEAQPLPGQTMQTVPGGMQMAPTLPGQVPPRIQPVPMAPSGVAPSGAVSPPAPWRP